MPRGCALDREAGLIVGVSAQFSVTGRGSGAVPRRGSVKPEGAAATATVTVTVFEGNDDWPDAFTAVTE